MQKILISACLLGDKVRYDGQAQYVNHPSIKQWLKEKRVVRICPEMAGGLSSPRPPAEINGEGGGRGVLQHQAQVITNKQIDVTAQFLNGASKALELVQHYQIKVALLKARSPSCGNHQIYSGKFSKQLVDGQGVTAALLSQHGVKVFNEEEIELAAAALNDID